VTQTAYSAPASMCCWMRSKGMVFASMSRSGALFSSDTGLPREISIIEDSQRAPLFMMLATSVR
jgi:hypothetical protein